jgi:hypothetical protein
MTPAQRTTLLMERLTSVIEGTELIRKECNRIRNEFLTLGLPIDEDFLGLIAHLQVDMVHLRVKTARMTGDTKLIEQSLQLLQNPMSQLSNEDPS